MNKMLVAVFDNEAKAYEGLTALKGAHRNGDITLYASAVVSKDQNGQMRINQAADEGPIGTATGLLTGSLIGLLGGPIGIAVGAATGMAAGLAFDVGINEVNAAFVDEVSSALAREKTALIAEIDETWTVPVDTRLEGLGGMVFRRLKYEVAEEQFNREAKALASEYDALKEELKEAREADKAQFNASVEKLKHKAQVTHTAINKKINEVENEMEAKVDKIEHQMREAGDKRRARLQKRIHTIKGEYQERTEKLKKASRLIGEAFGLREEVAATR